ncbi:reversion-inducing cysteine-rich protein with Kazal motifs-like [Sinocyclocheilus grahami]|uniref:reversion-inducing cysteine-rich protein with Kazal motifs-like n=1 Tax=Sinocyclocheilus grahami TaxID=75366 RepID=UPI0007AC955E|nr:PREDICTED: reversion-inducing cysteine-rich protein with Kazal motifs-like [Sinocyclocheilus grahami]
MTTFSGGACTDENVFLQLCESSQSQICSDSQTCAFLPLFCLQLATIRSESRLKHLLLRLPSYCPESLSELWICINNTLPGASKKSDGWVGLGCCELAISAECRRDCKQASSKNDIAKVCKKDTEKPLYSCITKNESKQSCMTRSLVISPSVPRFCDSVLRDFPTIKMPFMNIPVLDISGCQPEMWKTVACALQIKPCYSKSRGSVICRSDCVDILTQCGDGKRFLEGQTPERICDLLSATDDPERCIPLHRYLTPSPFENSIEEVIHPCNPSPCPSSQLCEVNRKGCHPGHDCLPYFCVPGCKLGEASEFLVPLDSRIQVPTRSGQVGCYEVCTCGQSGRLENCAEMPCFDTSKTCLSGGQRKSHGVSFRLDCQPCSCFAGESICSSRQCVRSDGSDEDRRLFTGLPCSCADHFVPVCARNGRTYPSACVARCVGFKDNQFVFGSCRSINPCSPNPCQRSQRYTLKHTHTLSHNQLDPVCDTDNMEHANLCLLFQRSKSLAYMGHCQDACRKPREVCGHNGETYSTVCEAFSDRVAVDYPGRCHAVGVVSEFTSDSGCNAVPCPPLSSRACNPVTPLGACCPVCAGMLQILWNKAQMNSFAKVNVSSSHSALH